MHEEVFLRGPSFFERFINHPVPSFVFRQLKYFGLGALILFVGVVVIVLGAAFMALVGKGIATVLAMLEVTVGAFGIGILLVGSWFIGFLFFSGPSR